MFNCHSRIYIFENADFNWSMFSRPNNNLRLSDYNFDSILNFYNLNYFKFNAVEKTLFHILII
jgi:hypothetical protein